MTTPTLPTIVTAAEVIHAATTDPAGVLAALLLLAVPALVYLASIRRRPWLPCRHCHGGADYDPVFTRAFGNCRYCGGTGRRPRLGARILHTHHRHRR